MSSYEKFMLYGLRDIVIFLVRDLCKYSMSDVNLLLSLRAYRSDDVSEFVEYKICAKRDNRRRMCWLTDILGEPRLKECEG